MSSAQCRQAIKKSCVRWFSQLLSRDTLQGVGIMAVDKTIVAVAIGTAATARQETITAKPPANSTTVRPYIAGVVDWLENQRNPPRATGLNTYRINHDYVIDYREVTEANLPGY